MGCMNEVYELGQHNVVDDQPGMKCFETQISGTVHVKTLGIATDGTADTLEGDTEYAQSSHPSSSAVTKDFCSEHGMRQLSLSELALCTRDLHSPSASTLTNQPSFEIISVVREFSCRCNLLCYPFRMWRKCAPAFQKQKVHDSYRRLYRDIPAAPAILFLTLRFL